MIVRSQTQQDDRAVFEVVACAFGRRAEAQLVDALRQAGDLVVSLVAEEEGRVIGHVGLSRMEAPFPALALAPLSVSPPRQRKGVGSSLVREAIRRAGGESWSAIFVLGNPDYYRRFGFDVDAAAGFSSPYAGRHFMMLPLSPKVYPMAGDLNYPPAFAALD